MFIDTSDGSQYEVQPGTRNVMRHKTVSLTIGQVDHEGRAFGNYVTTFLELTPKESKALRAALEVAECACALEVKS